MPTILDAAAGLTRYEAEGAFSLSLVRHGRIDSRVVWELKSGMLKKSGLLTLHSGSETFADLGGLDNLKSYCIRAMNSTSSKASAKGVMLLGVPGTGKSAFAKALGNETKRPTLTLDIGRLMGSLVGSTEQAIRHALAIADAMAPCVLFVDEVEKALAGQETDTSGVKAGIFGTLLTWLNDHTSKVFVVCTSNDLSSLPPEFSLRRTIQRDVFLRLPDAGTTCRNMADPSCRIRPRPRTATAGRRPMDRRRNQSLLRDGRATRLALDRRSATGNPPSNQRRSRKRAAARQRGRKVSRCQPTGNFSGRSAAHRTPRRHEGMNRKRNTRSLFDYKIG